MTNLEDIQPLLDQAKKDVHMLGQKEALVWCLAAIQSLVVQVTNIEKVIAQQTEALEYIAHELDDDGASARTMQRVAKIALGEDPDDKTPES